MKKFIAIATAAILIICLSSVSASAGSARRHTIEGIMIGTGVAILGAAIINEIHSDPVVYQGQQHQDRYTRKDRRHGPARHLHPKYNAHRGPSGYWKMERIWVAPMYEKRWNPGHYTRSGQWVPGRYESFMIAEGYYQTRKVWVRH